MIFQEKLDAITAKNNSLVCVGLDQGTHEFDKIIIDATHQYVCAYKPNSAFYEARGETGVKDLKKTCDYLREKHSEILIIIDAKRCDIGNTNEAYIKYVFDYLGGDAVTIQPY